MSSFRFFQNNFETHVHEFGYCPEPDQSQLNMVIDFLTQPDRCYPLGLNKALLLNITRAANIDSNLLARLDYELKQRKIGDSIKNGSLSLDVKQDLLRAFAEKNKMLQVDDEQDTTATFCSA